jgi:predicted NAD/FAD-binding protein
MYFNHKISLYFSCILSILMIPCVASTPPPAAVECDVAIVGAGAAGMYTAYQLSQENVLPGGTVIDPAKICLLEKNNYLGGNIEDVQIPEGLTDKDGNPVPSGNISTKAYRMIRRSVYIHACA